MPVFAVGKEGEAAPAFVKGMKVRLETSGANDGKEAVVTAVKKNDQLFVQVLDTNQIVRVHAESAKPVNADSLVSD